MVSCIMLLGFTSCEDTISEDSLVGRWEMQKIEAQGTTITEDRQVWRFSKDHIIYVTPTNGVEEYSGTWVLEGRKLTLEFLPIPVIVKVLNSNNLILEGDYAGQVVFRYTFKRL